MRAFQQAIVGVGLAFVAVVAMALLIGNPGVWGPDPSSLASPRATAPGGRLSDLPDGPPEPVAAAEDTSVGTLPPADASQATELVSRDLLPPAGSAPSGPQERTPTEGTPLNARKAAGPKSPGTSAPAMPGQDFTATQDGWDWSDWSEWTGWGERDDDEDDCRRDDRYDRSTDCEDRDRRD